MKMLNLCSFVYPNLTRGVGDGAGATPLQRVYSHLEEDYAIITFIENKRFSIFLENGPIKFISGLFPVVV